MKEKVMIDQKVREEITKAIRTRYTDDLVQGENLFSLIFSQAQKKEGLECLEFVLNTFRIPRFSKIQTITRSYTASDSERNELSKIFRQIMEEKQVSCEVFSPENMSPAVAVILYDQLQCLGEKFSPAIQISWLTHVLNEHGPWAKPEIFEFTTEENWADKLSETPELFAQLCVVMENSRERSTLVNDWLAGIECSSDVRSALIGYATACAMNSIRRQASVPTIVIGPLEIFGSSKES